MSRVTNLAHPTQAKSKGGCIGAALISLCVLLFVASMLTILLTVAIWPGEAKLTAPFLCPEGQDDAFVVTDTYQTEPGETSTNFTLYCVGPRGDFTDAGFFPSFAMLTGFHLALILLLLVLWGVVRRIRRGAGDGGQPGMPPPVEPVVTSAAPQGPPPGAPTPSGTVADGSETDFEPPGPVIS
jgi:hypothetical protein